MATPSPAFEEGSEKGDRPRSGSSVLLSPRALRRLSEAANGSTVTAGRNRGDLLVQALSGASPTPSVHTAVQVYS